MSKIKFDMTIPLSLFEEQDEYTISTQSTVAFYKDLFSQLVHLNLEMYYNDVVASIIGPLFRSNDLQTGISEWSVQDVSRWIKGSHLDDDENHILSCTIESQWIDGDVFMIMRENDWLKLNIKRKQAILLEYIKMGWQNEWGQLEWISKYEYQYILSRIKYSNLDTLLNKDQTLYGQFIVLGTKESKIDASGQVIELGVNNENFNMIKRRYANCHIVTNSKMNEPLTTSTKNSNISLDLTADMFQFGRSQCGNDFVVPGQIHYRNGKLSSPISRHAFRVECDRDPPHYCFLFASGFDEEMSLVAEGYISVDCNNSLAAQDYLTTYGVKLWNPVLERWCEISVFGNCYSIREATNKAGTLLPKPFTNQLLDGSIVDLCGVILYFQSAEKVYKRLKLNPEQYIMELNSIKPLCPVMMQSIQFQYVNRHHRAQREFQRKLLSNMVYDSTDRFSVPYCDYTDIEESCRPYVFPSCGHVHGFHKSLVGKACPLCRETGNFVPLAFALDSFLCIGKPTHVFNPCGHVATRDLCVKFSSIPFYLYSTNGDIIGSKLSCPICNHELNDYDCGGPFNRLIVQTDSGISWESDSDDGRDSEEVVADENNGKVTVALDISNASDNDDQRELAMFIYK